MARVVPAPDPRDVPRAGGLRQRVLRVAEPRAVARQQSNDRLLAQIESIHEKSRGTYGAPRVNAELRSCAQASRAQLGSSSFCGEGSSGDRLWRSREGLAAGAKRARSRYCTENLRLSYARYCTASASARTPMRSSPARSAIVRATRMARWTARALMPPRSTASATSRRPA